MNTLRDGTPFREVVEIKRVYQHPNYQYPKLYDDIAVVELGRRIAYDYDKVGNCLCLASDLSMITVVRGQPHLSGPEPQE